MSDNGASPLLGESTATTSVLCSSPTVSETRKRTWSELLGECSSSEGENLSPKKNKMDEDFKKFVQSVNEKLNEMPTKEQFDSMGFQIKKNANEIRKNSDSIDANKVEIAALQASIERIERNQVGVERGIERRVGAAVKKKLEETNYEESKREGLYEKSRRSIRLWPVTGQGQELLNNTNNFLTNALKCDMGKIGRFEVTRPPMSEKQSQVVHSEIIVAFENSRIRDEVASKGVNLAGYVDDKRKPTCGVRMDIPKDLVPTFNVLFNYGISLKKKMGDKLKKHIKFDDFSKSLFLRVKIGEEDWFSITPEEAKESIGRDNRRRNERMRSLISPEPRSSARESVGRRGSRGAAEEAEMNVDEVFSVPPTSPTNETIKWAPAPRTNK